MRKLLKSIALVMIVAGIAIMIHQVIYWNIIFELDDFLHHENFTVVLITIGVTIFFTIALIDKTRKDNRARGRLK